MTIKLAGSIVLAALVTAPAFALSLNSLDANVADNTPNAADNSSANAAPANAAMQASTADGQSNLASDLKITQRIRKSVMADKDLSTYAHNVKIVSVNGAVTLNGVVRTAHEKSVVAMKAQAVVGKSKVTNDLTVAPSS